MLCSPPSSVESERLFRIGGDIHTPHVPQPNNADEIDASKLQYTDLQFQLQETKYKVT